MNNNNAIKILARVCRGENLDQVNIVFSKTEQTGFEIGLIISGE